MPSSPLVLAHPTLDSNSSQTNTASADVDFQEQTNSTASRKRRYSRKVERKTRSLTLDSLPSSTSSTAASRLSSPPPELNVAGIPSSFKPNTAVNTQSPSIRRSARVSVTRRVRTLIQSQSSSLEDDNNDHYDADESGLDVKAAFKKGNQVRTDLKRNAAVIPSGNKRERKRSRTLKVTSQISTVSMADPEGIIMRGRTKKAGIHMATPLSLNRSPTMDTTPRHNKKRIQSESRTRAQLPPPFKKAKNVAQSEGSEDGSSVDRGKATRWTPEEDEALFEGVSLYLKSKGLQVHPPSHLPTEKDVRILQASTLSATARDAQAAEDRLGNHPQPLPRSFSVSSFSSLRSSSSSPFTLSPPTGHHPRVVSAAFVASATSTGSRESRESDHSSSGLLTYSSNEFASSSSSPSSLSSSSSICTGSTLTSDINHTLSQVHLGNSSFEDHLEKERNLKDEGFLDEDDEDDAMELFNRFVDSSSSPPPTQINQEPFPLSAMRLPSSFSTRQEPMAVSQPSFQPQTHLGQSTAVQGSVAMNWAWEGSSNQISPFQAHSTAFLAGSRGSTSGMTAPLILPYGDEFSVSSLRLNNRSSYQLPRESLRPLTPGEILAAESSSSSSSSSDSSSSSRRSFSHVSRGGRAWQEQMLTSMAMDGAPTNILERGRDRDKTQPTQESQSNDNNVEPDSDNVLTQDSYALAVSRALSHCPWSSVVQATPRLAGIRTGVQAQARWSEALDPQVLKGPWTEAEDQLLMQRVEQFAKCWIWIADGIPGRTQRQCRTRWVQIQTRLDREKAASITLPARPGQ